MYTGKYRIIQTSDTEFGVQLLRLVPRDGWFGFGKRQWVEEWNDAAMYVKKVGDTYCPLPRRFASEDEAQKWIDDTRKYPLIVKSPA